MCKWKGCTKGPDGKQLTRKALLIENYISTEKPPLVRGWTREQAAELKNLQDSMVDLKETALGEATLRFAMAVINNIDHLDDETKAKIRAALGPDDEEDNKNVI